MECIGVEQETQAAGDEWVTGAEAVGAAGVAAEEWDEASAALACGELQSMSSFEEFTALPTEEQVMVADVLAAALKETRSDSFDSSEMEEEEEDDDDGDEGGTGTAQEAAVVGSQTEEDSNVPL